MPVVELDTLAQVKCDGPAVVTDLPRLGEFRHRFKIEVIVEQTVVELGGGLPDGVGSAEGTLEMRRLRLHQEIQRPAGFGLARAGGRH